MDAAVRIFNFKLESTFAVTLLANAPEEQLFFVARKEGERCNLLHKRTSGIKIRRVDSATCWKRCVRNRLVQSRSSLLRRAIHRY